MNILCKFVKDFLFSLNHVPEVPGGKPRGLSLKEACQVSLQADAYMVKMFSR